MNWRVVVSRSVIKQLNRIPRDDAERIRLVIEGLVANPFAGDIEKIKAEQDTWRRRIGSYRLFYIIRDGQQLIQVFDLQRRSSHTY